MRLDNIVKAFRVGEILRSRKISVPELAEELGVSLRSAYRWLDAASIALPVCEIPRRKGVAARFYIKEETPCDACKNHMETKLLGWIHNVRGMSGSG